MPRMRSSATGIMVRAVKKLRRRDPALAYGLAVLAENVRRIVVGENTLDEFREIYVVFPAPINPDELVPIDGAEQG